MRTQGLGVSKRTSYDAFSYCLSWSEVMTNWRSIRGHINLLNVLILIMFLSSKVVLLRHDGWQHKTIRDLQRPKRRPKWYKGDQSYSEWYYDLLLGCVTDGGLTEAQSSIPIPLPSHPSIESLNMLILSLNNWFSFFHPSSFLLVRLRYTITFDVVCLSLFAGCLIRRYNYNF